ncbi:RNA-guided endonuclease InsQ/TnpB family protein [Streptomyces bauhiniae]|uniref:RNA-guided endonuclease InsQ/TnpB family protein n=1 Tax=Streptomyces bauhiniae TaxID=2340725 RepID=UPI001FCA5E7C|nr:transposase [Streptomyces bauhiniae]
MQQEILKAFRFALDPTPSQLEGLAQHAGAARWAFNHALGMKVAAHQQWRSAVQELVDNGMSEAQARKEVRVPVPTKAVVQKHLNQIKGDSRGDALPDGSLGPERPCPWWHEVNTHAFQSAFIDADRAWKNWLDSLKGTRAGRRVGYPRFKKKGRAREAFRLHHNVKQPTVRLESYRRLRLPTIGSVRLHDTAKRMSRSIGRGDAVIQSVTVSRAGQRWYASVLCKVNADLPDQPTRRQWDRGRVGVDLGVKHLAVLSQPLETDAATTAFVSNPRHIRKAEQQLAKAQRALSRTQKGSARRAKARRRVGRVHHEVAVRRSTVLHALTKQLATRFAEVAIEDLHVSGMTRSSSGTPDKPGRHVKQKAGLNRAILDTAPGELRRQLTYKTRWYGSTLAVLDRWFPSSKTCSACGWQNPRLTLADRTFHCTNCSTTIDRDLNAARNIAQHAVLADQLLAPGRGETQNARGAPIRPPGPRAGGQEAMKREDTSPARPVPPQRSDPLTLFTLDDTGHETAKRA